jgi:hypothetical protein
MKTGELFDPLTDYRINRRAQDIRFHQTVLCVRFTSANVVKHSFVVTLANKNEIYLEENRNRSRLADVIELCVTVVTPWAWQQRDCFFVS